MIRICHLINGLDSGGTERTLVNVVRHLDPSRFSNEVVSLIEPGVFGHDLRAAGIPLTSLGMRRGRPTLSGLGKIVRHLRQSRPTILQTWLYHADLLGTAAHCFVPSARLLWNVRCTDIATSPGSTRLLWITRLLARLSARPDAVIVNSRQGRSFTTKSDTGRGAGSSFPMGSIRNSSGRSPACGRSCARCSGSGRKLRSSEWSRVFTP